MTGGYPKHQIRSDQQQATEEFVLRALRPGTGTLPGWPPGGSTSNRATDLTGSAGRPACPSRGWEESTGQDSGTGTGTPSGAFGVLRETATIATGVIAAAGDAAQAVEALADRLERATDGLLAALGGGPPSELKDVRRLSGTATTGMRDARAAMLDAGQALRSFIHDRT